MTDVPVIVGGIIPDADAALLRSAGVAAVFTPKDYDVTAVMMGVVDAVRVARDSRRSRPPRQGETSGDRQLSPRRFQRKNSSASTSPADAPRAEHERTAAELQRAGDLHGRSRLGEEDRCASPA